MSNVLKTEKLFCERDDRVLFADLSFTVSQGEVLHIKGPNGAGKTTLLRRLAGLSWIVEGDVAWDGRVAEHPDKLDGEKFWYLAHKAAVTLQQTPLENLAFGLALHNQVVDEKYLWNALDIVGLKGYEDVASQNLSAGQQRRVALARLYIEVPAIRLWILDEPFTALDVAAVAQLEKRIEVFAESGGTVIMTSHHGLTHTAVRELNIGKAS